MKLIKLSEIKIAENRQRREFDAAKLHELADGISKRGLLHPIILRKVEDVMVLVAGERRYRAVSDLAMLGISIKCDGEIVPLDYIPYTLFDSLSLLEAEEAEIEENIHRENLTWQERAGAHARLGALRRDQAIAAGKELPTVADLAVEVRGSSQGASQETTRRELIVANHLNKPEIAAAKSVDEAFKILRKQESSDKARALGESVGRAYSSKAHQALNEDSLEWMQGCPAEKFDCIITDPPYGMGADEFGDSGGMAAGAHGYKDTPELANRCYAVLAVEGYRITKSQAHLYAFCDLDMFAWLKSIFAAAGWQVFRTPLIWYKKSGMRAPWPEQGPQRKYETILYAVKGKRPTLAMKGDVLEYLPDTNLGHAAQKPVALFQDLLRRTCLPGQSVLDPFMGSGTIFAAAHELKLFTTGIELDQASYGLAVNRLKRLERF